MPDVAASTATRHDLDVDVDDTISDFFACGDADEPSGRTASARHRGGTGDLC